VDRYQTICLCELTRRLSRKLTSLYQDKLAPIGLTPSQYIILRKISVHQPVLVTELAAGVDLDQSTITRNLAHLQKDKLIQIHKGTDARRRIITVTAKATKLLAQALPQWKEAQKEARSLMGPMSEQLLSIDL